MFFAFELESVEKCLSNIQCEHTYASKLPNLLDMIFMKYMYFLHILHKQRAGTKWHD